MLDRLRMWTPALSWLSIPSVKGCGENDHEAEPTQHGLRPLERRFLLACVRGRDDPAEIQMLLRSDLDWEQILDDATYQGVAPLVYSALTRAPDRPMAPPAVVERFTQLYYQQAAVSGHLHAELRKILAVCARLEVPVLVLKGAAIAQWVYGNIALCPMQDVDVLVKRENLTATDRLLRELGYVPNEFYQPATWYRDHHHHLAPYVTPDGRATVEVHHHIVPPPLSARIPIEGLWRRARQASGGGPLVLSPEDLLLHLCLHVSFCNELCQGLRPLCDISETIRRYEGELDWMQIRDRASQWGVRKYVALPLRLARDLVDAPVPEELLDRLQPGGVDPQVIAWARAQIFGDKHQAFPPPPRLARLCAPARIREKAALLLKNAFPAPRVMAQMYEASPAPKSIYGSYPAHWRNLLRHHHRPAAWLLRQWLASS